MPEELSIDEHKHKKLKQNIKNSSVPLNLTNHQDNLYNHVDNRMDESKKPKLTPSSSSSASSFFINDILNSNSNRNESNENEILSKPFLKSTQTSSQKNSSNLLVNENIPFPQEELFLQNQANPYNLAFLNGIFKKTLDAGLQPTLANMNMATMATMATMINHNNNNSVNNPSDMCSPMNSSCIDESRDYSKDDTSSISDEKDDSDSGKLLDKIFINYIRLFFYFFKIVDRIIVIILQKLKNHVKQEQLLLITNLIVLKKALKDRNI